MIDAEAAGVFREACESASRIVLTTHLNPDGDGIGSEIALACFLRSRGKHIRIINNDSTPRSLRFLECDGLFAEPYDPQRHDEELRQADLIVLLDNSAPDRFGRMERVLLAQASKTLCIDHHPSRHDAPWGRNVLDVASCATAAMVFELTTNLGWEPDSRAAEAIYVGLVTDTGFFRFASTSTRAHEIAATLLRLGVLPARAYAEIYERNSVAFTRLLGHCLAGLRLDAGSAVASVKITHQLIEALQAEDVDASEITTALLAMDGVRVAALFRELPDGRIKVSLRSKGGLDVHRLASEFGGGGHRNASGIVLSRDLDEVILTVTERAAAMLEGS